LARWLRIHTKMLCYLVILLFGFTQVFTSREWSTMKNNQQTKIFIINSSVLFEFDITLRFFLNFVLIVLLFLGINVRTHIV